LVARRHAGYGGSTFDLLEWAEYLARTLAMRAKLGTGSLRTPKRGNRSDVSIR